MPKLTLVIAGVLSALVLLGLLGLTHWQQKVELSQTQEQLARAQAERDQAQLELVETRAALETNALRVAEFSLALTNRDVEIARLQREKEVVTQSQKSLEAEMRHALESRDVTISELQGKLTVNILDRILFDSGEATVRPEGEAVLRKIAAVLAQYPGRQIHVIGHTDNVPIKATARSRFPSNWELSNARATAAVRFLSESAGVDPRRLGAVGYGEFHPLAPNDTPEGRARNRRIAIVVLSEELVGADGPLAKPLPPGPALPAGTNAPPER